MNNSKRNIHNSGALGMLVRSGQIKKIDNDNEVNPTPNESNQEQSRGGGSFFRTQSGIEFSEQELIYVDPKECESWKYANRLEDEMGKIEELMESIRKNKQLQPALVRPHPNPHDGMKYEIIFGRRRHVACLKLGINFLVIRKNISDIHEAVISQDAENKLRKDVSNYSNALLYKRLLTDKVFKSEKELANELGLTYSTFNDLMAYSKIPIDIIALIPNIHDLSNNMALKIVSLLNKSLNIHEYLLKIAPQIGSTISSPVKLDKAIENLKNSKSPAQSKTTKAKIFKNTSGDKLFTVKVDHRGATCFVLDKNVSSTINLEHLCSQIKTFLEPA